MKTLFQFVFSFAVLALSHGCSKDDDTAVLPEPVEAVEPVDVSFSEDRSVAENSGSNEILINFSKAAVQSGKIVVKLNGNFDGFFTTVPALVNSEIEIPVAVGAQSAGFFLVPVNNSELNGHKNIIFQLKSVSEGFSIGSSNDLQIELKDDELTGKPKSWESRAGIWRIKKTYEYDTQGRVSKINWENENPAFSSGTDNYVYNHEGKIIHISYSDDHRKYFFWENGKIIKSEEVQQGIIKRYHEFTYDSEGRIHSSTFYNRTLSGGYHGNTTVYEYFAGGDLKKEIQYSTTDVNAYIYSRRTYDAYITKSNPFPMVDLLPNIRSQVNLPGYVLIQENGMDLSYQLVYEYDAEGRVSRRTTNGESTTYTYY